LYVAKGLRRLLGAELLMHELSVAFGLGIVLSAGQHLAEPTLLGKWLVRSS